MILLMRRAVTTLAFVVPFGAGHRAFAEASRLHLRVVECEAAEVSPRRLVELIRTEISPRTLELLESTAVPLDLTCEVHLCDPAPDSASISLYRGGMAVTQRTIDLSDVNGDSRPRTLAVVLAEMLVAASNPLDISAPLAVAPQPNTPSVRNDLQATAPRAPISSVRLTLGSVKVGSETPGLQYRRARWRAGAGLLLRAYGRSGALMHGSWAAITCRKVTGELVIGIASSQEPTGNANLSYAALATTFDLFEVSTLPTFIPRIRVESGVSWASGVPNGGLAVAHQAAALTTAAIAELALSMLLYRSSSIQFKVLGGYSGGLTATADGNPAVSTSGWLAGAAMGIDFALSD